MVRILFLLTIVLLSNAKIAIAQSSETVAEQSCAPRMQSGSETGESIGDRLNLPLQQDRVLALSHNNPLVSRRFVSQTREQRLDAAHSDLKAENSSDSAISSNTSQDETKENIVDRERKIVTAGISLPSLWWAKEQFDPFGGKLISSWLTYPQIKQIDLTVNWQLWTLLDYLGRYRFINQFGTVAREYGYSLRIFNQQKQCLAYYKYNDGTNPPKWEINIEGIGEDSLQVEPVK